MTDMPATSLPSSASPLALAIALDLVTKYRLRLADQRDNRLGPLAGRYELAAARWTGERAALVAFYEPPADHDQARTDLEGRIAELMRWGAERMVQQGATECDVLVVARGSVPKPSVPSGVAGAPVRVGVAAVDPAGATVEILLPLPKGLPGQRELRKHAQALRAGAQAPTLAAVDLAERDAVRAGYAQPAQSATSSVPIVTYGLMGLCIAIWVVEEALIGRARDGIARVTVLDLGAAANYAPLNTEWWRYVSTMFVHSVGSGGTGIWHIAGNMMALFFFGRIIEQLYGRLVILGTFLLTGVLGTAAWVMSHQLGFSDAGVTIGASGGIAGLVGFLLMIGRIQGRNVPVGLASTLRSWVGRNLVFMIVFWFFLSGVVNNEAHVGGLLAGVATGCVLPPRAGVGGRDLMSWERLVLGALIAAAAAGLVIAAAHFIGVLTATPTVTPGPLGGRR